MAKRGTPEYEAALDDLIKVLAKAMVAEYRRTGKIQLPEPLSVFAPVAEAVSKEVKLLPAPPPAPPPMPRPYDGKRMLALAAVIEKVGLGRDTVYKGVRNDTFPQPVKLGRATRWFEHEIDAYLSAAPRIRDSRIEKTPKK